MLRQSDEFFGSPLPNLRFCAQIGPHCSRLRAKHLERECRWTSPMPNGAKPLDLMFLGPASRSPKTPTDGLRTGVRLSPAPMRRCQLPKRTLPLKANRRSARGCSRVENHFSPEWLVGIGGDPGPAGMDALLDVFRPAQTALATPGGFRHLCCAGFQARKQREEDAGLELC